MKKMAHTKMISIDEKIAKAKETFEKAKIRHDRTAKELEDLRLRRDQFKETN